MRKDLYTSFDAMSNVLMIDLGLLYKVVLCPRSGEGYFGLARRTYSLQCPPDIARYALIASHFASVMKQYPQEAAELFDAAQQNAQWRYKSYLRMLSTQW